MGMLSVAMKTINVESGMVTVTQTVIVKRDWCVEITIVKSNTGGNGIIQTTVAIILRVSNLLFPFFQFEDFCYLINQHGIAWNKILLPFQTRVTLRHRRYMPINGSRGDHNQLSMVNYRSMIRVYSVLSQKITHGCNGVYQEQLK